MGHVAEAFDQSALDRLTGASAIGHVRYSTAGEVSIREAQPFLVTCQHGQIAVCHNGNLPFAREERRKLEQRRRDFLRHFGHGSDSPRCGAIAGRIVS